jgi:LysM repeat protein
MQKLLSLFFIVFLLSYSSNIIAQTKVETSNNIVQDINGNNFYLHHVLKGQTLYAIAKAYDVKVNDIIASNPGSENGIKEGQDIKIPIVTKPTMPERIEDKTAPEGFVYHRVKKGETLYRIMFNYQVTLQELQKYNNGLNANIQPGQQILIPKVETRIANQAASKYDSIVNYTLKRRDNYYRLSKKFKISQQQIEQLNPSLKTTGLQKGLTIKVPYVHDDFEAPQFEAVVLDSVKPELIMDNVPEQQLVDCGRIKHNRHIYKIGFMLPIYSNLDDEIDVENEYKIKKQSYYKSFRFIQFIQGAKLALDSLEKLGFKAEVYFWDTQANERKTDSICNLVEFSKLDLLIGPFYSKNVKIAREYALNKNIKMVDLFGSFNNINDTIPSSGYYIMQANEQSNYNALAKYISDSIPKYRISIIHQGKDDELQRLAFLKKALYSHYLHIDTNRIFIYKYEDNGINKIIKSLNTSEENIIFNLVDNEARIGNFLRQVNLKKKDEHILVMAIDKYWDKYKTLELNYLNSLHYTSSTDFFIDNSDSILVIPFQNQFYNTYKRMPEKMAYLAYDISWYFGNALYYYGGNFSSCLHKHIPNTMHNGVHFNQIREGIYLNNKSNIIQYDNYQKIIKN